MIYYLILYCIDTINILLLSLYIYLKTVKNQICKLNIQIFINLIYIHLLIVLKDLTYYILYVYNLNIYIYTPIQCKILLLNKTATINFDIELIRFSFNCKEYSV